MSTTSQKIQPAIGSPIVSICRGIDRWEGQYGPNITFKLDAGDVLFKAEKAEQQLSRHNVTPEQTIGRTLRVSKTEKAGKVYTNLDVVAAVKEGEMTAPLTKAAPAKTAQPISMGGPLPSDDQPLFDEDGNPIEGTRASDAPSPVPALADGNAERRAWITQVWRQALQDAYEGHCAIEATDIQRRGDTLHSGYTVSAEAANAGAATLMIAYERLGMLRA